MSQKNSHLSISLESGLLNASLGVDHGIQGGPEREQRLRPQPWIAQLQKKLEKSLDMSSREIIYFSLTSGEYSYLKLWISSSIEEKEVETLHGHIKAFQVMTTRLYKQVYLLLCIALQLYLFI